MSDYKLKDILAHVRLGHYQDDEAISRLKGVFDDEAFSPHRLEELVLGIVRHVAQRLQGWTLTRKTAEQLIARLAEQVWEVTTPAATAEPIIIEGSIVHGWEPGDVVLLHGSRFEVISKMASNGKASLRRI